MGIMKRGGLAASCAVGVFVCLVQIRWSYGSDEVISLEEEGNALPRSGDLGESTAASNININTTTSSVSVPSAAYVHCVPASNPVCPPHICTSIKSCPVKNTNEPIMCGPVAWNFLHTIANHFKAVPTTEHVSACRKFLEALPYMLPCGDCGTHLKQWLDAHDKEVKAACKSREGVVSLMVQIHNDVNKKLKKPTWTTKQATQAYSKANVCVKNAASWPAKNPLE